MNNYIIDINFIIDYNIFNYIWFEYKEYIKNYYEMRINYIYKIIKINYYKNFDLIFFNSDFDFDNDISIRIQMRIR